MKAPMKKISWFSINRSLKSPMMQYLYAKKTLITFDKKIWNSSGSKIKLLFCSQC